MNCENCKKNQATVFYADESGGRHSLCSSCAKTLGRISQYDPAEGTQRSSPIFIPEPTLLTLTNFPAPIPLYYTENENRGRAVCPFCATSLESAVEKGRVGCPDCYTVFGEILFPSALTPEIAAGARMPSSRRSLIDRVRTVNELKAQIRLAVESENYELAATLRDKIRKLESGQRT